MIRSMTAFATLFDTQPWGTLTWEIRSVNHRYLEVSVRMPEEFRTVESKVRELVQQRLGRGKVECMLRFKAAAGQSAELQVNEALAAAVLHACATINSHMHVSEPVSPLEILQWPGVVQEPEKDLQPLQTAALNLFKETLNGLIKNREQEGGRLKELIQQRHSALKDIVEKERMHRPEVMPKLRQKLLARLQELQATPDMDRLEQELVYLAQKLDVDEELDRMNSHLEELAAIFNRKEPVGRRLDFLMQELNREANTLGSKSVDIETTQASVELKVLIEQIREQVQNIE